MKVVMKFDNKKKLSPRYNGPSRISKRVGMWLISWSYPKS